MGGGGGVTVVVCVSIAGCLGSGFVGLLWVIVSVVCCLGISLGVLELSVLIISLLFILPSCVCMMRLSLWLFGVQVGLFGDVLLFIWTMFSMLSGYLCVFYF